MRVLVAELSGDYAFFRAHETTRENLSYPFPPRTALLGMLAAMMGKPRNEYWLEDDMRDMKIGIQLMGPLKNTFIKVNYQSSKTTMTVAKQKFVLHPDPQLADHSDDNHKNYMKVMRSPKARGQNMPIRLNYLVEVYYRIFISGDDWILDQIKERLISHKYVFPPYLGHANLLARWRYIDDLEANKLDGEHKCDTIVSFNSLDMKQSFAGYTHPIIYNVPMSMRITDKKSITIQNMRLDTVSSLFINEYGSTFIGYFNELYTCKIDDKTVNFSFLV